MRESANDAAGAAMRYDEITSWQQSACGMNRSIRTLAGLRAEDRGVNLLTNGHNRVDGQLPEPGEDAFVELGNIEHGAEREVDRRRLRHRVGRHDGCGRK